MLAVLQTTLRAMMLLCLPLIIACTPVMRSEKTPGSFAWFDLITDVPAVSQSFYSRLFGWQFAQGRTDNIQLITNGRILVGGMVTIEDTNEQTPETRWQPVLSVTDTAAASTRAQTSGGQQIGSIFAGPNGTLAAVRDPGGAPVTLYDGTEGIPLGSEPPPGSWVWVDLLTPDPGAAETFYRNVSGFETRVGDRSDTGKFRVFTSDGKDRGGLIRVSRKQASHMWLPYVLVENLGDTIDMATKLGARLAVRGGDLAILIDPAGAAFGIAQRPAAPK
ncbi:27 kDa antigen Cfp30B [Falsiruegeria litorea R37]|uniref:27 kDa antigen Cfp30B n=2 Tax=Falsiruegeria litorea TaxID=1280831 RepID=A0A1Y5SIM0_9RHOB|nr:27 kDa antigen Cfp30B [Falsiruegeria litorea R37]